MSRGVIWHVSSNRWNSAVTEYALSAARALDGRGWTTVFTPLVGSPAESRGRALGLDVRPLTGFGPSHLFSFARISASIRPDVIIVYGGPEAFLIRLLPSLGRVRNLRFMGQDNWRERTTFLRLRKRFESSPFDLVIAPSRVVAKAMTPYFSVPVAPVTLGLDASRFQPTQDPAGENHTTGELILFGRFDPVKGHDKFFRLISRVHKRLGADAPRIHVAGKPANIAAKELVRAAESAGLKEGSTLRLTVGRVNDVPMLMTNALAGVVASLGSELICRVAEEFLLCGTPVIVSGVGSLGEVVFPGAGINYDGRDTEDVVASLADFILAAKAETPEQRQARANTARELFSLETMGRSLDDLIATLP